MLKRILSYILIVLLTGVFSGLAGCSDSFDSPGYTEISSDGTVTVSIEIPAIRKLATRAEGIDAEYKVNDLHILIYTGEGENTDARQYEVIYADDATQSNSGKNKLVQASDTEVNVTFKLDKELRGKSDIRFYFVANMPESAALSASVSKATTENELKAVTSTVFNRYSDGSYMDFTMSGYATLSNLIDNKAVLTRNCAKVTVNDGTKKTNEEDTSTGPDYTVGTKEFAFEVFGAADESKLLAGWLQEHGESTAVGTYPAEIGDSSKGERYIHPTANKVTESGLGGECFLIVKTEFEGNAYYYRLDFIERSVENGELKQKYFSPTSNHWYQFVITAVKGAGYSTPEEAAKHPEGMLEYEIHDHSPLSFNMASDGFRELGVSHEVIYNGIANSEGEYSELAIDLKFYSKNEAELPAPDKILSDLITIEEDSWLALSEPEEITDPAYIGGEGVGDDHNDAGKIYRFKLQFKQTGLIGTLENTITVKWMGLQREIPITWIRDFDGSAVTSAKLTMTYGDTTTEIEDYWAFLTSTDNGEASTATSPSLWGVQKERNNGKVRDEGFHFPVMYGDADTGYAEYAYTLTFDKEDRFKESNYTWEITVEGDDAIRNAITATATEGKYPLEIKITRLGSTGNDDYTYATGKLKVVLTFTETGDTEEYSFDLYHTGFFHKDSQKYRLDTDNQDSENYYYYEVVPITVDGKTRYILDRNLGAKSAENYIRNSDGSTLVGNPDAAGGFYTIAYQKNPQAYVDATMYDDESERVSPPGYRVPQKRIWDVLRNSSSFHTESAGEYFYSYYNTGHPKIGRIYFPKAMMYQNGGLTGDSRSGYYWTQTAATGTEKEEIGKWLQMFTLSGNTTSYTNGCVTIPSRPGLEYGASVRCINDVPDDATMKRTSFNVSGATHVYLYRQESDGTRSGTTTWPGHVIGDYQTMTDGHWFGFAFESTEFDPNDLYVIFNFMDSSGIIHTFSQDDSGSTILTDDKKPIDCIGWKVTGDNNVSIMMGEEYPNKQLLVRTDKTALGNWWLCSQVDKYVHHYKSGKNLNFRVYWPYDKGTVITLKHENGDLFNNDKMGYSDIYGYYSFDFSYGVLTNSLTIGYPENPIIEDEIGKIFSREEDQINSIYLGPNSLLAHRPIDPRNRINQENPLQEGSKRIYMVNRQPEWKSLKIHYWGGEGVTGTSWPGIDMTCIDDNPMLWYADIPENCENIIFDYYFLKETGSYTWLQTGAIWVKDHTPDKIYDNL